MPRQMPQHQQFHKFQQAIVALPAMLLAGGIIVEIGIAGAFISYFYSQGSFGAKLSEEALSAAQSGIQDAMIKIIRDKNFSSSNYDLVVDSRSANIVVCKDSKSASANCDTINVGKDEITSIGTASVKKRKLRSIVSVNSITGEVKIESTNEIQL